MNDAQQYLICYDTPNDKRRRRIVGVLEELCQRVQWSVFEGWLTSKQYKHIRRRLSHVIDPEQDNLRIYRLCAYCQADIRLLGVGERTERVRYWIC